MGALLIVAALIFSFYAVRGAGAEAPPAYHTVAPGETLWEIAIDYYPPSEDPRAKIEEIRDANGLDGYLIHPGTQLEVPASSG